MPIKDLNISHEDIRLELNINFLIEVIKDSNSCLNEENFTANLKALLGNDAELKKKIFTSTGQLRHKILILVLKDETSTELKKYFLSVFPNFTPYLVKRDIMKMANTKKGDFEKLKALANQSYYEDISIKQIFLNSRQQPKKSSFKKILYSLQALDGLELSISDFSKSKLSNTIQRIQEHLEAKEKANTLNTHDLQVYTFLKKNNFLEHFEISEDKLPAKNNLKTKLPKFKMKRSQILSKSIKVIGALGKHRKELLNPLHPKFNSSVVKFRQEIQPRNRDEKINSILKIFNDAQAGKKLPNHKDKELLKQFFAAQDDINLSNKIKIALATYKSRFNGVKHTPQEKCKHILDISAKELSKKTISEAQFKAQKRLLEIFPGLDIQNDFAVRRIHQLIGNQQNLDLIDLAKNLKTLIGTNQNHFLGIWFNNLGALKEQILDKLEVGTPLETYFTGLIPDLNSPATITSTGSFFEAKSKSPNVPEKKLSLLKEEKKVIEDILKSSQPIEENTQLKTQRSSSDFIRAVVSELNQSNTPERLKSLKILQRTCENNALLDLYDEGIKRKENELNVIPPTDTDSADKLRQEITQMKRSLSGVFERIQDTTLEYTPFKLTSGFSLKELMSSPSKMTEASSENIKKNNTFVIDPKNPIELVREHSTLIITNDNGLTFSTPKYDKPKLNCQDVITHPNCIKINVTQNRKNLIRCIINNVTKGKKGTYLWGSVTIHHSLITCVIF